MSFASQGARNREKRNMDSTIGITDYRCSGKSLSAWSRFVRTLYSQKIVVGYLLITWVTGILLVFFDINPSRPDEADHWNRVISILQGHWIAQSDPSGSGNYGLIKGDRSFVAFNNTAINSPYTYWPSLLSGGHYRLASVLTLLLCSLMIAVAIYLAGDWGNVIFAVAILPTTLISMTFPTSDAVSNATAFLYIGAVLYCWQKKVNTWGRILLLTLVGFCLGQAKVTSNVLILLLIPLFFVGPKFDWRVLIPFVASPLSYLFWSKQISAIPPSAVITVKQYHVALAEIVSNPGKTIQSLLVTFVNPMDMVKDPLNTARNIQFATGSGNTQLPWTVMLPVFIAVFLIFTVEIPACGFLQKGITLGTVVAFYAVTVVGMIASWGNPVPGGYAGGLQNRYFIPMLPLLGLLLPAFGLKVDNKKKAWLFIWCCIIWTYVGLLIAHLMSWPVR
ncbi:DUF2142 domain-containing protein [Bifidobacterium sp. SMB2]|nr:DUF2142 domain-containing protein [Bifidobacterium sp. SMB2]